MSYIWAPDFMYTLLNSLCSSIVFSICLKSHYLARVSFLCHSFSCSLLTLRIVAWVIFPNCLFLIPILSWYSWWALHVYEIKFRSLVYHTKIFPVWFQPHLALSSPHRHVSSILPAHSTDPACDILSACNALVHFCQFIVSFKTQHTNITSFVKTFPNTLG